MGFGEERAPVAYNTIEPTPKTFIESRRADLCNSEINSNFGRSPCPTWRLTTLGRSQEEQDTDVTPHSSLEVHFTEESN